MRLSLPLRFLGFTLLLACGSVEDRDGGRDPRDTDDTADENQPTALALVGSYDVTIDEATADLAEWALSPPDYQPASLRRGIRLDLREGASGVLEAVVTGRWNQPAALDVLRTSDALILSGRVSVSDEAGVVDTWETLTLPMRDGLLVGTLSAAGDEGVYQGDVGWNGPLRGTGHISRDQTAPELRLVATGTVGDGLFLPWDPLLVTSAEPVLGLTDAGALQLRQDPATRPFAPAASEPVPTEWAGRTSLSGLMPLWPAGTWSLETRDARVHDPAGNIAAPFTQSIQFTELTAPGPAVRFQGESSELLTWGATTRVAPGPLCENGCLQIGAVRTNGCSVERAGFASWARTFSIGGALRLRYRVLLSPTGGSSPRFGNALTFELASSGYAPVGSAIAIENATELESPIEGMTHATAWSTVELVPVTAGDVAVAVFAGDRNAIRGGCGGPPPGEASMIILVESVD